MLASQLQKNPNLPSSTQLADDMLQRLDDIESYCQSLIKQQKVSKLTCWIYRADSHAYYNLSQEPLSISK